MAASLLDMRLLLVTGKGGVGKTTVCASLGLQAAKRGKRVLLVEVAPREHFTRLLGAPEGGHAEHPVAENVWALNIDPLIALEEYLETQIHVRAVVRMIMGNPIFRRLVNVAPGWRDLITLGKVWHLERQQDPGSGRPKYDLFILDAPATGQGLGFLRTPQAFVEAVRFGPAKTHSQWVRDLIEDPERTRLVLVTLPEELPVNETIEMARTLRERIHVPFEHVVVNAVAPKLFTDREAKELRTLREDSDRSALLASALGDEARLEDLLGAADAAMSRRALHEHHLRRLRARLGRPGRGGAAKNAAKTLIELPFIYRSSLSLDDLRGLGEILEAGGKGSPGAA
jgi:anion-transporting  ArsA/GET3 family ATPase